MKTKSLYHHLSLNYTQNELNALFDATNKVVIGEQLTKKDFDAISELSCAILSRLEANNIRGYVAH